LNSFEIRTLKDEPMHKREALNEAKQRLNKLETLKPQAIEVKDQREIGILKKTSHVKRYRE